MMRYVISFLVVFLSIGHSWASVLVLKGHFVQGGLALGHVPSGIKVTFAHKYVPVTPYGSFVIGFSYNSPSSAVLTLSKKGYAPQRVVLHIASRHYVEQRITGLPSYMVSPPRKAMVRIAKERKDLHSLFETQTGHLWFVRFFHKFSLPVHGRLTTSYGSRRVLDGKPRAPHLGVDLAVPEGTPIKAPVEGVVSMVRKSYFAGNMVVLDHGHGVFTRYAHMSKVRVQKGERVPRGGVIGYIGHTGRATGPHLDWRLNVSLRALDPRILLKPSTTLRFPLSF